MLTKLLALAGGFCLFGGLPVSANPSLTNLAPPLPPGHTSPQAAPNDNCDINIGGFGPATSFAAAYGAGFFDALGVKPCYYKVTSSSQQFNEFFFGNYDVLQTALDNMMNRFYNGQPLANGTHIPVGITALGALELQPSLTLVAAHGIQTPEDFNGRTLFVDAVDSGLLYAAQEILAIHGQYVNTNYQLFPCGGKRYVPVITGTCTNGSHVTGSGQATLISGADLIDALNPDPSTAFNQAGGKIIARVSDYLNTIGTSIGSKPSVLNDPFKSAALQKTVIGVILGHRFASNPANADALTSYLATLNGVSSDVAATLYAQATSPIDGVELINDLHVDQVRLTTMFDLRYKFNGFVNPLADFGDLFQYGPGHFIDYTIRDAAADSADNFAQVFVDLPDTLVHQCWHNVNPNSGVTVSNVISVLSQYVSGGCVPSANRIAFNTVSSSDQSARLSDFTWDGANFHFAGSNIDSRTFTATFNVFQACSAKSAATITQSYTFTHGGTQC